MHCMNQRLEKNESIQTVYFYKPSVGGGGHTLFHGLHSSTLLPDLSRHNYLLGLDDC